MLLIEQVLLVVINELDSHKLPTRRLPDLAFVKNTVFKVNSLRLVMDRFIKNFADPLTMNCPI